VARKSDVAKKALYEMHALQTDSGDHDNGKFMSYKALSLSHRAFVASVQTVTIPRDWQSTKQDPKWQEAMIEELEALKKNKTWVLDVYARVCSCRQCWASKCRGL
jgi:hypothetical protein